MTVFFSGCLHRCKGCHNPISHEFDNGRPFTEREQDDIIEYIKETPFISGVTLSGGDPMYSAEAIIPFAEKLKSELPGINIWIYSGFLFEDIIKNRFQRRLLELCDVLIDGPFVLEKKQHNLKYKGSINQRTINVQQSLKTGTVTLLEEP